MIRFTTKPEGAPTAEVTKKTVVKQVSDEVQLSLDPDSTEEETPGKATKRRSSIKSK